MSVLTYVTPHGITVTRTASDASYEAGLADLLNSLDRKRGIYLSSGYEYPGRYSRWDIASLCPPLEIVGRGLQLEFRALNDRGRAILAMLRGVLADHPDWERFDGSPDALKGTLRPLDGLFSEEERSRQPSIFTILRALVREFRHPQDSRLALIGAFGYDLLFQFDPIRLKLPRDNVKDIHLFLCDDIWFMDRKKETVHRYQYEFAQADSSTVGLAGGGGGHRATARHRGRAHRVRPHAG
jgi:anthranilate synthase